MRSSHHIHLPLFLSIRVVQIHIPIIIPLKILQTASVGVSVHRSSYRDCRQPDFVISMPSPEGDYVYDAGSFYGAEIDGADVGYIKHCVSKYDTLAGVAIKYGVEVADIKKMNGLVTDLQMFALPSLRIPLPGRHPPSPSPSNGSSSPRLKPPTTKNSSGGAEVGGYKLRKSYEKSRTPGNDFWLQKGDLQLVESRDEAAEGSVDSYRRRWSKSEFNMGWEKPAKVLREENDISSYSSYSSVTGKSLALRPKSGSRGTLASDDSGWLSSSSSSGDSPTADAPGKVHKSFSLSSMPDMSQTSFSSFWSNTTWNFKSDLQSLSTSTLTKPLIEGLPIVTRKIKAAPD